MQGLQRIGIGAIAIVAALFVINWLLPRIGFELGIGELFSFGASGVYLFIGLVEVITNKPFFYWGQKWMALKAWQRGVFGTLFLLLVLVIFIAIIPLIA
jgi:hypothetical protein